jgi:hypothetical protein
LVGQDPGKDARRNIVPVLEFELCRLGTSLLYKRPGVTVDPVVSMPMLGVILWMFVTLDGSVSLSGTFFCVTKHTQSFPRTAMAVIPASWQS